MALPTTRLEFIEYCLKRLGKPVIEINVSDDQVADRVDESLKYYYDYHFDGSEKLYYKHQITADDITNEYITLPENIMGAVEIFDIGGILGHGNNMFALDYQFALNNMHALATASISPYYMTMTHLNMVSQLLNGEKPIRYNRHTNKLRIDMDWTKRSVGEYLVVVAYEVIDPETYTDAYSDRWLLEYCSEKIKQQWGTNMKKMEGVQMIGGITFSGQQIYNEATQKIAELEREMIDSYSIPTMDMLG